MTTIRLTTTRISIKSVIDAVVGVVFFIIILGSISGLTFSYIKNKELRTVIQMKDVRIEALILSCQMDYLIKIRRPDLKERFLNKQLTKEKP